MSGSLSALPSAPSSDHYLELLARKPGALTGSLALHQERQRGAWPDCFDELWRAIVAKVGASEAARQMVDVLMLVREHGPERVELAVHGALAAARARWPRRRRTGRQGRPTPAGRAAPPIWTRAWPGTTGRRPI